MDIVLMFLREKLFWASEIVEVNLKWSRVPDCVYLS